MRSMVSKLRRSSKSSEDGKWGIGHEMLRSKNVLGKFR